jgi:hypothetical protein
MSDRKQELIAEIAATIFRLADHALEFRELGGSADEFEAAVEPVMAKLDEAFRE